MGGAWLAGAAPSYYYFINGVTWHQVLITSKSIVSCEYLFPIRRERGKNSVPWLFRLTYEIRANRGFNFKRDRA